jgi:VWFA-related protein
MRKYAVLLCLAVLCASVPLCFAQSRRTAPVSPASGKSNQRPDPKPTPTPDPQNTAATNNDQAATANPVDDGEVIRVETDLVTIPVRIMDRKNRFFGGLKKEDFHVFEDGVEQEVALFSNEAVPFTVALVLDMSPSTKFKITEIQQAAIAFISQLRENDQIMVVSFDHDVHMLCEATNDRQKIYRAIKSTKMGSGTSLYDAMDLTMNDRIKKISGRKAIVLFTDGVDTTSRMAHDMSNLSDAMELDALIYPIRYDTYYDVQAMQNGGTVIRAPGGVTVTKDTVNGGIPPSTSPVPTQVPGNQAPSTPNNTGTSSEEYRRAEQYLNDLAIYTGGRLYLANSTSNLTDAFAKIASELREFYSLGYYPKGEAQPGKKRKLKVRLDRTDLVVRARDSYVVGKKAKKGK